MWPRDALLVVGLLGSVTPAPGGRWPRHQERCGAPLLVAAFVNDTSHLESGELSRLAAVVRCCRLAAPTIRHQQGATLGGADLSASTAAAAVWRHCDPRRPANLTDASPPTIVVRALAEAASLQPWGGVSVRPGAGLRLDCVFPRDRGRPGWTWTSSPRQYLTGWAVTASERSWKYRLALHRSESSDTGLYTCSTPRGLTSSVAVAVTGEPLSPHETYLGGSYEDGDLRQRAGAGAPLRARSRRRRGHPRGRRRRRPWLRDAPPAAHWRD
ncbi:uncharacterized protein LOC126262451 [Schistocerca nitens]|uniref:uncharacterized protein LOC126262451 n=1 Tax=Schistocerca nitens TaxID=7011 RepID=UPI0021194CAA|nr:uncharacterized protein LOC126262451 [Schistocerca nitens]